MYFTASVSMTRPAHRVCFDLPRPQLSGPRGILCVLCVRLPPRAIISITHGRALRTAVAIWLPASREVCSLAGLPEGGRGKVMKAETQTGAFCYLVAVLVNDRNGGEGNGSCRVSTALWIISRKLCRPACSRAGSGFTPGPRLSYQR